MNECAAFCFRGMNKKKLNSEHNADRSEFLEICYTVCIYSMYVYVYIYTV